MIERQRAKWRRWWSGPPGGHPWSWTGPRAFGLYLMVISLVFSMVAIRQETRVNGGLGALNRGERCVARAVQQLISRTATLTPLSVQLRRLDDRRQHWTTVEQNAFKQAINGASQKQVKKVFSNALDHYLRADARYQVVNAQYTAAVKAHPVPKLRLCPELARYLPRPSSTPEPSPSPTSS